MLISRRTFGRAAFAAGLLIAGPAFAAEPEQVEIRFLASQGSLAAHELADALGYFKGTGITLKNVGYAQGGPASCEDTRTMARTRITDLQRRIDELVGMRDALARLIDTCGQPRAERDCPILHDIETVAAATLTARQ